MKFSWKSTILKSYFVCHKSIIIILSDQIYIIILPIWQILQKKWVICVFLVPVYCRRWQICKNLMRWKYYALTKFLNWGPTKTHLTKKYYHHWIMNKILLNYFFLTKCSFAPKTKKKDLPPTSSTTFYLLFIYIYIYYLKPINWLKTN